MLNKNNNFIETGKLIDERYRVVNLIGSGAMGTVIHCKDISLRNSDIVLKFLKQEYVDDEKQFERFKNEALLMRELNHPNVVHVYDLRSTKNKSYYITMEHVNGSSLKALVNDLKNNSFRFLDSIRILKDISCGMSYAHKKGIIHRDLKPDNVLISEDGEIKITDFGLGKELVISEDISDLGEAVGTPHYMSPEQLKGIKLDKRCDIYSFGIMAYELITGEKPFNESNYMKLAERHINEDIPKIKNNEIPNWYNKFIAKCCAKNKEDRFQSFDEICEILESFHKHRKVTLGTNIFWQTSSFSKKFKDSLKILTALTTLCLLTFLISASNKQSRVFFGPKILHFEKNSNTDLGFLKKMFFGEETSKHLSLNKDSLSKAIQGSNAEAVNILLQSNIEVNKNDLLLAVKNNHLAMTKQIVNHLVAKKILFTKRRKPLDNALRLAIENENTDIIKFLVHSYIMIGTKVSKNIDAKLIEKIKDKEIINLIKAQDAL